MNTSRKVSVKTVELATRMFRKSLLDLRRLGFVPLRTQIPRLHGVPQQFREASSISLRRRRSRAWDRANASKCASLWAKHRAVTTYSQIVHGVESPSLGPRYGAPERCSCRTRRSFPLLLASSSSWSYSSNENGEASNLGGLLKRLGTLRGGRVLGRTLRKRQ